MITYVSKVGVRSEHSLDDVMLSGEAVVNQLVSASSCFTVLLCYPPHHYLSITGRLDIAKRLKYTKDIMYRLINTQSK